MEPLAAGDPRRVGVYRLRSGSELAEWAGSSLAFLRLGGRWR